MLIQILSQVKSVIPLFRGFGCSWPAKILSFAVYFSRQDSKNNAKGLGQSLGCIFVVEIANSGLFIDIPVDS